MYTESHLRAIVKAVSWRIWGTITTAVVVFVFTKKWDLALSIGALEFVLKTVIFYVHERVWNVVSFGRTYKDPTVVSSDPVRTAGTKTTSTSHDQHAARSLSKR